MPANKSTPPDDTVWDVGLCVEFGTILPARGVYRVDTTRGTDEFGEPRYINTGGFGVAVDVVDTADPAQSQHVLRISQDEEVFDKLRDISHAVNDLLGQGNSPFFLRTRTAFVCDEFPAMAGGDWRDVAAAVAQKFGGQDFFDRDFTVDKAVPVRLFYLVMERAELFDARAGLLDNWAKVEDQSNRDAHGLTLFKRTLAFQLTQGLAALHEVGISHRDITPANVVFSARPGPATDDVFMLQDDAGQRLVYEVPRQTSIPGVFGSGTDKNQLIVTPHFIDYDLAIRVISGNGSVSGGNSSSKGSDGRGVVRRADVLDDGARIRVLHASRNIRGSPETIAPEVFYLSAVGLNDDPELLFKPDTYSLGVLIGEILTGYSTPALLARAGFREDRITRENAVMMQAAYTGFPARADLIEYQGSFDSRVRRLRENAVLSEADQGQINSVALMLADLLRWQRALDDVTGGRRADDPFRAEFGLSAVQFRRGVLFDFLDIQRKKLLVDRSSASFLRKALNWDFRTRPRVGELLSHPFFDVFQKEQIKSWQLPVSALRLQPTRPRVVVSVVAQSPGPRDGLVRRAAVPVAAQVSINARETGLPAQVQAAELVLRKLRAENGLCSMLHCSRRAIVCYSGDAERTFCSEKCARLCWSLLVADGPGSA